MKEKVKWTAVVLTTFNQDWVPILQSELDIRKQKGFLDENVITLIVEDPKSNVGSGGATVNALLRVAEYISAQKGFRVVNPEVLLDCHVLILHCGRDFPFDPCGRGFVTLPLANNNCLSMGSLITNIDLLIKNMTETIAVKSKCGVWICSTDMMLTVPKSSDIPWNENCDVCAISVPCSPEYCKDHGVYKINSEGYVEDILYQKDLLSLTPCERPDGTVPVVSAIVFLSYKVTETLISFHTKPPLDACTYIGLDSGQTPLPLSLFFDIMLPMATDVNEDEFISGSRGGFFGKPAKQQNFRGSLMKAARKMLWKELRNTKIWTCLIEDGSFHYIQALALDFKRTLMNCPLKSCDWPCFTWTNFVHSNIKCTVPENSVIINSIFGKTVIIEDKSVVSHSRLDGNVQIEKDSLLSGVLIDKTDSDKSIKFGESMVVQGFHIYLPTLERKVYVLTTHGRFDDLAKPMYKSMSSYCNEPWILMLSRTGMKTEDLWGTEVENESQSVLTAKLFPVFHATEQVGLDEILWLQGEIDDHDHRILSRWKSSWRLSLSEILCYTDLKEELECRRTLFYDVCKLEIFDSLMKQKNIGFRSIYNSAGVDNYSVHILEALDKVAEESRSPGVTARALANIADVLGCMAGMKGGLRSGPAANKIWAKAFQILEEGEILHGVKQLANERVNWLDRPDKLIRAARHYEGAAQILIRKACMTAKEFYDVKACDIPDMDKWVITECPARIDLSGGWSDTPPITYEHSGAVAIASILINGKRPIGAKARRTEELEITLVIFSEQGEEYSIVCKDCSDMADFHKPNSPGALLKAAFIATDLIEINSQKSLREQLLTKYQGGFELHSWSHLPHGSGLGTSSILAGAVINSLLRAAGRECDKQSLVHIVLYLEQILTTGGGWQDQVGGLMGGINLALSEAKLPVKVEIEHLGLNENALNEFEEKLVMVYTGITRLARNLLQEVVRNWYARNPEIVAAEDELVVLAQKCSHALIEGDFEKLGCCFNRYWELKKVMAPGCEPMVVKKLMDALRPYSYGIWVAGAGGGGFVCVLMKEGGSNRFSVVQDVINKLEYSQNMWIYKACIDLEGMVTSIKEDHDPSLHQNSNSNQQDENMEQDNEEHMETTKQ